MVLHSVSLGEEIEANYVFHIPVIYLFIYTTYVCWSTFSVQAPTVTALNWTYTCFTLSPTHPSVLYSLLKLVVLLPTRLFKIETFYFLCVLPHLSTSNWSPIPLFKCHSHFCLSIQLQCACPSLSPIISCIFSYQLTSNATCLFSP